MHIRNIFFFFLGRGRTGDPGQKGVVDFFFFWGGGILYKSKAGQQQQQLREIWYKKMNRRPVCLHTRVCQSH